MANLTQGQIDERVAILRKFRSLLEQQRDKFREYLKSLEFQEKFIEENDTEALVAHAELEEQVVSNISGLQKVIVPMCALYHATNAAAVSTEDDKSVWLVQEELSVLQEKVIAQNKRNRMLLRLNMDMLKGQLSQIKNPYKTTQSIYAMEQPVAQLVHVEA